MFIQLFYIILTYALFPSCSSYTNKLLKCMPDINIDPSNILPIKSKKLKIYSMKEVMNSSKIYIPDELIKMKNKKKNVKKELIVFPGLITDASSEISCSPPAYSQLNLSPGDTLEILCWLTYKPTERCSYTIHVYADSEEFERHLVTDNFVTIFYIICLLIGIVLFIGVTSLYIYSKYTENIVKNYFRIESETIRKLEKMEQKKAAPLFAFVVKSGSEHLLAQDKFVYDSKQP
ncbi:hypothetical protein SNEBB_001287 [Seison nebaliae]|nr:hypothetical protein SNEBB_001287 [Seison nebaliae]